LAKGVVMAYGQGSLTEDTRSGKWKARYIGADGKQHCKTFGPKEKVQARKFLAAQTADRARGTWLDPRGALTPFDEWAESWFAGRHNIGPQSRNRDRSIFENHVLPTFSSMPLGRIGPLDVKAWVNELVAKGLAPRTIRLCHFIFSAIMRSAVASKLIPEAPVGRGVVTLPKVERYRERFLTEIELERLARQFREPYRLLIYTAAYSGCRWQELSGLKWSNLDLVKGVLHVRGVFKTDRGRIYWAECPKTDSSRRSVNLPQRLVAMLKEIDSVVDSEFVFRGPDGGILRESSLRRVWGPAVNRAGLTPLTFHDLRHTHAAWLIRDGVQPLALQRRLGHKDIGTTMDVYGHLFPNAEDSLVELLDRRWSEALEENAKVISLHA
jgi:integrase